MSNIFLVYKEDVKDIHKFHCLFFWQRFLFYEIELEDIDTLLFPVVQMVTTTATPEQQDVFQTLS